MRGRRVALLGLTFKPDTDDLRDAPALTIASELIEAGRVGRRLRPDADRARALGRSGAGLEVVERGRRRARAAPTSPILVTEWPEFVDIDWAAAGADDEAAASSIDGRNVLTGEQLAAAGFTYTSFGRGTLMPGAKSRTALVAS